MYDKRKPNLLRSASTVGFITLEQVTQLCGCLRDLPFVTRQKRVNETLALVLDVGHCLMVLEVLCCWQEAQSGI